MATSRRIVVTGGTGMIGRRTVQALVRQGHTCVVVTRGSRNSFPEAGVETLVADPTRSGDWQAAIDGAGAVINLAGARLVEPPKRWTARRKALLRSSRVETTARVAEAIAAAAHPPDVFLSGSAIGIYGDRGDARIDEQSPPGTDFLSRMCADWEAAAGPAVDRCRVVWLRTGLVLDPGDGFLAPMLPFFRLGLGAGWGNGRGWLSWIHWADEVGLILAAMTDHRYAGPINCTAPEPVTVNDFTTELARVLRRPSFLMNIPEAALRVGLGQAADALVHLQRALPSAAEAAGYDFRFATLRDALNDLLG